MVFSEPTPPNYPICTDLGEQWVPDISGNIVVWVHDANVYGYDLSTSTEFPICTSGTVYYELYGDPSIPAIDGDIVVWQD